MPVSKNKLQKSKERYEIVHTLKGKVGRSELSKILKCSSSTISRMLASNTYEEYQAKLNFNNRSYTAKKRDLVFKETIPQSTVKTNDLSKINDVACISALNSILEQLKLINYNLSKRKFIF